MVTKNFNQLMPNEPVCTNIPIQEDAIIEEDETFLVRLSPGLDAVNVIMDTATVFITDNDGKNCMSVIKKSQTFLRCLNCTCTHNKVYKAIRSYSGYIQISE